MSDSRILPQLSSLIELETQFSLENVIHNDNICTLYLSVHVNYLIQRVVGPTTFPNGWVIGVYDSSFYII